MRAIALWRSILRGYSPAAVGMGNRRSREFRLQRQKDASWNRLRSEPWHPHSSYRASDSGHPRIQLVRLPSFSLPEFWEVCQRGDEWLLYTATVVDPDWENLAVQSYEPVSFDPHLLASYVEQFGKISVPVAPPLTGMAGLDGTVTQLALFGDLWSQVRYQWWSDSPACWAPMVHLADEMLNAFGSPGAGE